jgi:catechol 2,3-dioxygenase-like lactoylglutathione lyase family enzyme
MPIEAIYVHTNLVAADWRRLSAFYSDVLGCVPLLPERHLTEPWVATSTGVAGAELHGQHLRLPGLGADGPTLEILQYNVELDRPGPAANRPGFGHIAFRVDDVPAACAAVLAAGGGAVGQCVEVKIPSAGRLAFAYMTDPEGNIIELQHWA